MTGSWKPPFCTGQKNIMTTNIAVVAECLKYEADEYKKRYDEVHRTKERELKEGIRRALLWYAEISKTLKET